MIRTAIVIFSVMFATPIWAACAESRVDLKGGWGQARFTVEVADDPAERSQGLMNVPSMPSGSGMLFVYDAPQRATF